WNSIHRPLPPGPKIAPLRSGLRSEPRPGYPLGREGLLAHVRPARRIALYYPLNPKHEGISMSAVRATGAAIHNAAPAAGTSEAELAHKFHHYMLLMREIEDRIEHKLYRQGKVVGGVY